MDWKATLRRWTRLVAGIGLVVVGLAGLVIPVVPGLLPILAGLALLAPESPLVQRLLDRARALTGTLTANPESSGSPDAD